MSKLNTIATDTTYSDENNPAYLFSTTSTDLLSKLITGEIDIDWLMRRELAQRGVDQDGKWVGFAKAKEIHQI